MPNLRALRRLLRVRTLEEEQRQAELEAVLAASHHLESMVAYQEQGSRGQQELGEGENAAAVIAVGDVARVQGEEEKRSHLHEAHVA